MKLDLRKNSIFVPIFIVAIYFLLRIFEWVGLNSTQGYILQLMLIGYVAVYALSHKKPMIQKVLIILGGVFCLIGDMFLGGAFKNLLDATNLQSFRLPFGMLGFFIGNILWFISLWYNNDNISLKRFFNVFSIVAVLLVALWSITILNTDNMLLSVLALVYCFCLGLNLTFALSNLKVNPKYKLLVIGYALFIFSDLWIGVNDIKNFDTNPYVLGQDSFVIWITYISALALIILFHATYEKNKVITKK